MGRVLTGRVLLAARCLVGASAAIINRVAEPVDGVKI